MESKNLDALNVVQQVLRPLLIALIAETGSNAARISSVLEAAAANGQLMPEARAMLRDLAMGLAVLGSARQPPN